MKTISVVIVPMLVIVAGFLLYVMAGRYALHDQTAANTVWPARPAHATIIFGGDMLFDRSIRKVVDVKGGDFIFSCIDSTLENADLVVANLEGPITEHASVSATSTPGDEFNYTFTFPPSTAKLLYAHNIRIVNLGNNHILNFGAEGARSTIRYLQDAGVAHFGSPVDYNVATSGINGIRLAFINYNEFGSTSFTTSAASTTVEQIQEARGAGAIPVVYTHWGIEYATTSPEYVRDLAHSFIDAGAEIVIGSHPHVVQEMEAYQGKRIYYSLGNFIFDQYFSEDVTHGLLLEVTFGADGVLLVEEIPIELGHDRRTCPVE